VSIAATSSFLVLKNVGNRPTLIYIKELNGSIII